MSSTLNPDEEAQQVVKQTAGTTDALGPGDSSDSGSDVAGAQRHEFDVDSELDKHSKPVTPNSAATPTARAQASGPPPMAIRRSLTVPTSNPTGSSTRQRAMGTTHRRVV